MSLSKLVLGVCIAIVGFGAAAVAEDIPTIGTSVVPIDYVIVPSKDAGVLTLSDVECVENGQVVNKRLEMGMFVQKDKVLGVLDDDLAKADVDIAQAKLDVAKKEATNETNLEYAKISKEYEAAVLNKMHEANKNLQGPYKVYPDTQVMEQMVKDERARLQIEQSQYELKIAQESLKIREAELAQANVKLEYRKIKAPFDGQVVEVFQKTGQWVQPGAAIVQLVGTDRMHIRASVDSEAVQLPSRLNGMPVTVTVHPGTSSMAFTMTGKVDAVSPMITEGYINLKALVLNPQDPNDWKRLSPGVPVQMTIHLQ